MSIIRLGNDSRLTVLFQLMKAKEEITQLKKRCEDCDHEITRLKGELKQLSGDYGRIANRSKLVSVKKAICLNSDGVGRHLKPGTFSH